MENIYRKKELSKQNKTKNKKQGKTKFWVKFFMPYEILELKDAK